MTDSAPVHSVADLDLTRYLGRWYEVARLPLKWEDEAATDITAHYSLADDGSITVDNRCFDEAGEPTQSLGRATTTDVDSQLKVSFLPKGLRWLPFTEGDYWVLKIDDDYRLSLVGTPDRKNLWLLSRTPDPDQGHVDSHLAEARAQGFDLTDLIVPRHTGREVTDDLVAED